MVLYMIFTFTIGRNMNPLLLPLRIGWIREAAAVAGVDPGGN